MLMKGETYGGSIEGGGGGTPELNMKPESIRRGSRESQGTKQCHLGIRV